jgi:calcineurin-like phosphoesterase family protein
MNQVLIKNWNECVRPNDTIYVVGDMALCSYKEFEPIAKQLNGIKYLIKGNHDHYSIGQYNKLGFTVFEEVKMKLAGKTVRLSHYPYWLPWYKRLFAFKSQLRYPERRPPKIPGEYLIHGHSHAKYKMAGNSIHVGVDANNFYPVSAKEIESWIAISQKPWTYEGKW